uniref:Wsv285-like protein n=1 Tax=Metapenaeus ensis nimavirus TaxID=2133794 RepID=A0A401IPC1_9VIRU|nr:MAG: wsv285-like protein [Metapenaeus ensis nimavirus]GBG35463.1 wsv285-like protein [Metapenaeus ensis nimavirus]
MFSTSELQVASHGRGHQSPSQVRDWSNDGTQDVGALGISSSAFKDVLEILKKRSRCLFLGNSSRPPRQIITDKTTQSSLSALLALNKPNQVGNETKKFVSKYNVKTKLEAEEAAIKRVFRIMSSTQPSKDNPLGEKNVVLPADPWTAVTEEQLEYLFREGVTLDVVYGSKARQGRWLDNDHVGLSPFLLTVGLEIRILQCALLNFSWFGNRLFRLVRDLKIESSAKSSALIQDGISNNWREMTLKHEVRKEHVPQVLEFLKKNFSSVYKKIALAINFPPTYFAVDFQVIDNVIGLANNDLEHQGCECVEWRCFNNNKKFNGGENPFGFGNQQYLNILTSGLENGTEDVDDTLASSKLTEGGGVLSTAVEMDDDSWTNIMAEMDANAQSQSSSSHKTERFKSGTSIATIKDSSAVSLVALGKGEEIKALVCGMIKFIEGSITSKDEIYMCEDDDVFGEDQVENYENYKDLYKAAICSNPANVYRVLCHLFVNLIMPRLRNPMKESKSANVSMTPSVSGSSRSKLNTDYGCEGMRYGVQEFAKGKIRVSKMRICPCRQLCQERQWFDAARAVRHGGLTTPDSGERRYHNTHRSCCFNFQFFDRMTAAIRANRELNKKTDKGSKKAPSNFAANNDHLAKDQNAFDTFKKCFPSAGVHHIFCPHVLVLHRGANFNIDLKNSELRCVYEGANSEETLSCQKVDAKEALSSIIKNKLMAGADSGEEIKNRGLSLREYSRAVCQTLEDLYEITNNLCISLRNEKDNLEIVSGIRNYVKSIKPSLDILLTFVDNKELRTLYRKVSEISKTEESYGKGEVPMRPDFDLFRFLVRFFSGNYNASVATGINKRGYLCNTATITGYRFKIDGTEIKYHESVSTISQCIVYADYYSQANNAFQTSENESASLKSILTSGLRGPNSRPITAEETEAVFMALYGEEVLGEDGTDDENDHDENYENCPSEYTIPETEVEGNEAKRRATHDSIVEMEGGEPLKRIKREEVVDIVKNSTMDGSIQEGARTQEGGELAEEEFLF